MTDVIKLYHFNNYLAIIKHEKIHFFKFKTLLDQVKEQKKLVFPLI